MEPGGAGAESRLLTPIRLTLLSSRLSIGRLGSNLEGLCQNFESDSKVWAAASMENVVPIWNGMAGPKGLPRVGRQENFVHLSGSSGNNRHLDLPAPHPPLAFGAPRL